MIATLAGKPMPHGMMADDALVPGRVIAWEARIKHAAGKVFLTRDGLRVYDRKRPPNRLPGHRPALNPGPRTNTQLVCAIGADLPARAKEGARAGAAIRGQLPAHAKAVAGSACETRPAEARTSSGRINCAGPRGGAFCGFMPGPEGSSVVVRLEFLCPQKNHALFKWVSPAGRGGENHICTTTFRTRI